MPVKILVVDDEPDLEMIVRQKFRAKIRNNEFDFHFATNGVEALNLLAQEKEIGLVLTDINMPEMDGLTLLAEIEKQYPLCKSVIISAYGDMENIRTAMNRGAFDFLTKPINLQDLEITVEKMLNLVNELLEKVQLEEQKQKAKEEALELERKNRFIRETFGCFLTEEVVHTLLDSPEGLKLGGEMREVTVLMSDLRGFTAMCESLTPERVVTVLNRYLETMVNVIMRYGGTIDEFIGDGILVIFGAPIAREDHAEKAVACAVAMQQAMSEVNAANRGESLPHLEMGIGINTGEMVIGNIGSPRRMKYGVVGSHVNLAARIESCTIGGQVLISENTYQQSRDLLEIHQKNEIFAKGFKSPVTIYDIKGIGAPYHLELRPPGTSFKPLAEEIPVQFVRLHGKQLEEAVYTGSLVQLSRRGGVIRAGEIIEPLTTLKIIIPALETAVSGDLFAKVLASPAATDTSFPVHFTAVPPEVQAFIDSQLSGSKGP